MFINRDLLKRVGMLTAATAACTAGVFGALALNGLRYMRPTADNWWLLPWVAPAELKTAVRPEFLNRIDDIIVFNRLNEDEIAQIADGMLRKVAARMQDMEITMDWTEAAKKHLAKAGFDPVYGARPLRRAVTNEVEDLVAEESLEGKIKKGDSVTLDAADDKLVLTHKDAKAPAENENKDE